MKGGIPTELPKDPYTARFYDGAAAGGDPIKYLERSADFYSQDSLNHKVSYGGMSTKDAETCGGIWYEDDRQFDSPSQSRPGGHARPLVVLKGKGATAQATAREG